jgi:hypothetical protein
MINKILFTRDISTISLKEQLEFVMPVGYKLFNPDPIYINHTEPTLINFKIKLFSEKPITLLFNEAIHSMDFKIIDRVQMIPPNMSTELTISIINPNSQSKNWQLESGSLIATMVPVETVAINLFEVSNKVYKKYV